MIVWNFVRAFALFWYDFIVGDSMTLALGTAVVVGLAFVVTLASDTGLVEVALPLAVAATLYASLRRS
jgi:hypothetical protein